MQPELRPLAIFGECRPEDLTAIKQAKAALNLDFNVTPINAEPGCPVRIIALRVRPNFICDYALISDPSNPKAVLAALGWALDPSAVDSRATLVVDMLQEILGADVKEVV